ncbi:MAG: hypothetical protein HYV33_05380 [Candidatus Kerfeldbacteria bacterium]|nr:hypothetical protein [Candidatus Kerfeldbacteria bacterium]
MRRGLSIAIIISLSSLVIPGISQAANANTARTVLHQATIRQGYTLRNLAGTFAVGIPGRSFKHWRQLKRVGMTIEQVRQPQRYPVGDQPLVGDLYRYTLRHSQPVQLRKKVWLELSYPADQIQTTKIIKLWNPAQQRWQRLKTKDDSAHLVVRASIRHRSAIVAVFQASASSSGDMIAGYASWYDWHGAASNDFPLGSVIRVTNVSTQASVDSTVVSTGPFVPGRVVDLPRDDFAKIADLSAGVVAVTVQQVQ